MDIPRIHAISGKQRTLSEGVAKNAHGDAIYTQNNLTVTKHYVYDPFGNEINPDPNDSNPFRYCGEYFDVHSGTYYLRNRYYYPRLGRFTTIDPIKDGHNWYVYCNNNPIISIDPFGLKAGQYYDTVEEAIDAWIRDYAAESFELGIELGSVIYYKEIDNYRVCAYTEPVVGTVDRVKTSIAFDWREEGTVAFSYIHTHTIPEIDMGGLEGLSSEDMLLVNLPVEEDVNEDYISGYAVTNNGNGTVDVYGFGESITNYVDTDGLLGTLEGNWRTLDTKILQDVKYESLTPKERLNVKMSVVRMKTGGKYISVRGK